MKQKYRAYAILGVMGIGLSFAMVVHEVGHSVTCSYFGYDSPITINFTHAYAICEATGIEEDIVRVAGGGSAAALFGLLLIPPIIRRNDYLRAGLLVGGTASAVNAIWETAFSMWYDSTALSIIVIVGVALTMLIERRRSYWKKDLRETL